MATVQRDMFVETDERLLIKDNPSLKAIADALPEMPILRPYHIYNVLPIQKDTLYKWIKAFKFEYIDLCGADDVARYGIVRRSFLEFLATRVNKIV